MQVGVLGMNHRTSELPLRESFAKACEREFKQKKESTLLLSTCNRVELYFAGEDLAQLQMDILSRLRPYLPPLFEYALYTYFGRDSFYHLGRVIAGLDSAIFGESEIQRQVKLAYETHRQVKKLPFPIHYVFQKGLKVGKEIRTSLLSSKSGSALAESIFSIVDCLGGKGRKKEILFIGNSAINRTIISHFSLHRENRLTLCTRVKGEQQGNLSVVGWEELQHLERYEAVISGAYHHEYILKTEHFSGKKKGSLALFDLSVPRTIDPQIGNLPSIALFNIDQLGDLIEKQQRKSAKEIDLCENMLEKAIERQTELYLKRREAKWQKGALWEHFKVAT